jgi:hypothetical protein
MSAMVKHVSLLRRNKNKVSKKSFIASAAVMFCVFELLGRTISVFNILDLIISCKKSSEAGKASFEWNAREKTKNCFQLR